MDKVYNKFEDITRGFSLFLQKVGIRKTQLNIIPIIIVGMIMSESCVALDIAKKIKKYFPDIQLASIIKRIGRFFNNKLFKPYEFYHSFIMLILQTYQKKHKDKRVHIIFDHMFSKSNYTVFMITMRIGKHGIPLWFKCFPKISNNDAFKFNTLKEGIQTVSDLFKDTDFELIFLADRWFGYNDILSFIDSLGHTYCIRLKGNINVYKDGNKTKAKKLKHHKHKSTKHENVLITNDRFKTNIVISDSIDTKTPWIIATNGDLNRAIKDYSYRFGAIECVFKSQKSNGFNLEKVSNANLKAFETMYTLICVGITYLTILGTDYSKNTRCYRKVKIETHKEYNKNSKKCKERVLSLFNTGLTLFNIAFESCVYIRMPFSFILYDG